MDAIDAVGYCLTEVNYAKSVIVAGGADTKAATEGLAGTIQGLRMSIRGSAIPMTNKMEFEGLVGACMQQVTIIRTALTAQEAASSLDQLRGQLTSIRTFLLRFT